MKILGAVIEQILVAVAIIVIGLAVLATLYYAMNY